MRAETARERRARQQECYRLRVPPSTADKMREHVNAIREAESAYNAARSTGEAPTPREVAALQGLGSAIELADLLDDMLAPPISRQRRRSRTEAGRVSQ